MLACKGIFTRPSMLRVRKAQGGESAAKTCRASFSATIIPHVGKPCNLFSGKERKYLNINCLQSKLFLLYYIIEKLYAEYPNPVLRGSVRKARRKSVDNITNRKDFIQEKFTPLNFKETAGLYILAVLLTVLSNGAFLFASLAAAVYAVLFLASKNKWTSLIPPALSLGILFLFSDTAATNITSVFSPIIIGAALAFCISKRKKVFTCIGTVSVLTAVLSPLSICAAIYDKYGSVIDGFHTFVSEIKPVVVETVLAAFETVKEANGLDITLSEDEIVSLFKQMLIFLPACIFISSEILATVTYAVGRLLLKIRKRNGYFFKYGSDCSISVPTAVAFIISGFAALLFSFGEDYEFISCVFINACSLLIVPLAAYGVIALVRAFKKTPDNKTLPGKRHAVISLALIVLSSFANPLFGVVMVSSYGAFAVINEALANRISRKNDGL